MAAKVKLGKTTVEKLQPGDGVQVIYWDKELTGFGVRVSPGLIAKDKDGQPLTDKGGQPIRNPTRTFFYQGRLNGRVRKYTIGRLGRITAEAARKEARRIASRLELGHDPAPKKEKTASKSFGDLMTAYVELLETQGKASARSVKNQVTRDIEKAFPRLWKKPAAEIDLDDCMEIVYRLKDAEKPRQADKIRSYIRSAFSAAVNARGNTNVPPSM
ncbi:MAG: Arm DNA-binding domain-containing protein, partial [Gammaproteobacteria bacterium]|nr:Arm DNA-binding domain-containing protein [Gammaproteobacteria bacterium]